ncbi:NTP transferase domain-containing protein [Alicyclobacillus curvatus]|nr:NTP transferase domain-containing protein [Alicyclobacillus curvatus]
MMEAIILAGGLGTRLASVLGSKYPKPLAPINDKPFLYYLVSNLKNQGVDRLVLACGYLSEMIEYEVCEGETSRLGIETCIVKEDPHTLLGTAGAVRNAIKSVASPDVFLCNGDTYSDIDLKSMLEYHQEKAADITIALTGASESDRYGSIVLGANGRVKDFVSNQNSGPALINSGTYIIRRTLISEVIEEGKAMSLEHEFLPHIIGNGVAEVYGFVWKGYFRDIGVPVDYKAFVNDVAENKISFQ